MKGKLPVLLQDWSLQARGTMHPSASQATFQSDSAPEPHVYIYMFTILLRCKLISKPPMLTLRYQNPAGAIIATGGTMATINTAKAQDEVSKDDM